MQPDDVPNNNSNDNSNGISNGSTKDQFSYATSSIFNTFGQLPLELIYIILSHCLTDDIVALRYVCKDYRNIINIEVITQLVQIIHNGSLQSCALSNDISGLKVLLTLDSSKPRHLRFSAIDLLAAAITACKKGHIGFVIACCDKLEERIFPVVTAAAIRAQHKLIRELVRSGNLKLLINSDGVNASRVKLYNCEDYEHRTALVAGGALSTEHSIYEECCALAGPSINRITTLHYAVKGGNMATIITELNISSKLHTNVVVAETALLSAVKYDIHKVVLYLSHSYPVDFNRMIELAAKYGSRCVMVQCGMLGANLRNRESAAITAATNGHLHCYKLLYNKMTADMQKRVTGIVRF